MERLKAKKSRANKNNRKDKVAYVELGTDEPETFREHVDFNEGEVDLAELKQGPPYSCKVLTPSSGKNPVEPNKDTRFPKNVYTLDVTMCDKIFYLLVKDSQMIVPPGAKIPPLEQRKKRGFLSIIIFWAIKPHMFSFQRPCAKRYEGRKAPVWRQIEDSNEDRRRTSPDR